MTTRDFKFLVFKSTVTSLSTAGVDFTITNAELANIPVITGSRVRPLDGRTEARPWTLSVVDGSSFITRQLASTNGRLDMLNRFVQARMSIDGSTYAPVAGGRLIDLQNAGNIATWDMTVQDEWLAGSNTMLFTTNTTFLYPPRPMRGYKDVGSGWAAIGSASRISTGARRYWKVTLNPAVPGTPGLTDEGVAFIRGDLTATTPGLSTKGSFNFLRFRVGVTDYKVVGFKTLPQSFTVHERPDPEDHLFDDDALYEHQRHGGPLTFWVAASSTAFGGTGSKTFELADGFITNSQLGLHAMSAPASNATPLHIWNWSTANPYGTLHPMQVLKDILDGNYSASSEALPYYSTQAFTGSVDVRRLPTVGVAHRITSPAPLKDWCEEHLLAPHGIAAFGDPTGKVTFKSVLLPDPQLGYSTANLYTFTSTNLRQPHPDWRTTRREQVTQVQLDFEITARSPGILNASGGGSGDRGPYGQYSWTPGGDGIAVATATDLVNHDRIGRYGVWPVRYAFDGYGALGRQDALAAFPDWVGSMPYYKGTFVQQVFNRFGDGPIQGTLSALPNASTVAAGDFARLTLASYPNISSGGYRGGTRLVQILTKDVTPEGYQYEYLDAGSVAAPLSAPTLTLSTSTAYPKHAFRVSVSGIPTGGIVSLYAAESQTTSAPGSTSAAWHPVFTTGTYGQVTATSAYVINRLKSGQRYFLKGQAAAPNKPRSAYSASVTKVTEAITAPSALTMSSVKAQTAGATWTVGDGTYPVDLYVDTLTTVNPSTSNLLYRMPAGTNRTLIQGLTQGQAYKAWVRHADPYGGYSGSDSTTFTMTSTATTSNVRKAPLLGGLYTVFGST